MCHLPKDGHAVVNEENNNCLHVFHKVKYFAALKRGVPYLKEFFIIFNSFLLNHTIH